MLDGRLPKSTSCEPIFQGSRQVFEHAIARSLAPCVSNVPLRVHVMNKILSLTYPSGLHARPSTELARILLNFDCKVLLKYNGNVVAADSVLEVLSCCVFPGDVEFEATGPDAEKALDAVTALFQKLNTELHW